MLIFFNASIAQNQQSRLWTIPPKQVSYNLSGITGTPNLPTIGYSGQTSQYANNCMHDLSGNLLFFIVDGTVYDKHGSKIGEIWATLNNYTTTFPVQGTTEWVIIPVPGNCKQYYLVAGAYTVASLGGEPECFYITLDLSIPNTDISITGGDPLAQGDFTTQYATHLVPVNGYAVHNGLLQLAVTPLRTITNDRLLFMNDAQSIYTFLVTSGGIATTGIWAASLPASCNSGAGRNEMELVGLQNGNYRVAVAYDACSTTDGFPHKIFVGDFNPAGNIVSTPTIINLPNSGPYDSQCNCNPPAIVKGLELSLDAVNGNGRYLYVTHVYPPYIEYADIQSSNVLMPLATITSPNIPTPSDFQYSQIEIGYDGKLYFASGNRLATLATPNSPVGATWVDNAYPITVPISNAFFSPSENSKIRLLNDQRDGEDYNSSLNATPECCIFNTTFTVEDDYVVSGPTTQTWTPGVGNNPWNATGTITVKKSITIPAGYKITITGMTFEFAPRTFNATLKGAYFLVRSSTSVLAGARLTLNNSVMKSYTQCGNGMWEGVWVEGVSNQPQGNFLTSKQGWLTVKNNSIIEDAYRGVFVGRFGNNDPVTGALVANSTGGIVRGNLSKFYNNQTDVFFNYYTFANSLSNFYDCVFETNAYPLLDGFALPSVHAIMIYENGLSFAGCDFQNTNANYTAYANAGLGIFSFNTGFGVTAINVSTNRTNFKNLQYGVFAFNSTLKYVSIDNSEFTNNYRGIYFGNVNWCTVTSNNFNVFPWTYTNNPQQAAYGLYLDRCKAFHVEDNFFNTPNKLALDFGIVVNEENPTRACGQYDEIYRNRFTKIYIGCQSQGNNSEKPLINNQNSCYGNAFVPNNIGVNFRCNDYFYNTMGLWDINVADDNSTTTFGNIAYQQGFCSPNTNTPAGNQFSHSFCPTPNGLHNDYRIGATYTPTNPTTIDYSEHSDNGRTNPYCWTPLPFGVSFTNCSLTFNAATSCYSKLNPCNPCQKQAIASYQRQIDSVNAIITSGDAQSLYHIIATGSSGQIKNALLAASPYLSDGILIAAINKGLPPGIIKQIILANSPLSPSVLAALNAISLPPGIRNQINAAQTGVSAISELYQSLSYYEGQKSYNIDQLIRDFLADTTISTSMDSVIFLLKKYNLPESQCEIAKAYLSKGDTATARSITDSLALAGTDMPFCNLMNVLIKFAQNYGCPVAMASDATVSPTLTAVAGQTTDTRACVSADGMLKYIFGGGYQEWIQPIQSNNLRIAQNQNGGTTSVTNNMLVFPNPASDQVTVMYNVSDVSNDNVLFIYDVTGRVMEERKLSKDADRIVINTGDYAKGVYICALVSDGAPVDKVKFVIIK